MNENELSDKVEDVLDEFDFHKVQKVMEFLEWKWAKSDGVPTVGELRKRARNLLRDSASKALFRNEFCSTETGGLRAECWPAEEGDDIALRLSFILESFDTLE